MYGMLQQWSHLFSLSVLSVYTAHRVFLLSSHRLAVSLLRHLLSTLLSRFDAAVFISRPS